jgi:hypothetical protein
VDFVFVRMHLAYIKTLVHCSWLNFDCTCWIATSYHWSTMGKYFIIARLVPLCSAHLFIKLWSVFSHVHTEMVFSAMSERVLVNFQSRTVHKCLCVSGSKTVFNVWTWKQHASIKIWTTWTTKLFMCNGVVAKAYFIAFRLYKIRLS